MRFLSTIHATTRFGLSLVALVACLLSGCGGYSASAYTAPSVLTSIAVTPTSEEMTTGTTARLTAIGHYSNGTTADITTMVTWTSASTSTASVGSSTGTVTGVAAGNTTITASMNSGSTYGMITSPPATIQVTTATLTGITIAPLTTSVPRGSTTTFTAAGAFSDSTNGNISGEVTWSSSDTAVATINAGGIATGVGMGTSTISAALNAITNTASLTVF